MRLSVLRLACAPLCLAGLAVPAAPATAQDPPAGVVSEELLDAPDTAVEGAEAEAARAYADGDLPRAIAIYRELGATHEDPRERARLRVTAAWLLFELGDRAAAGDELRGALFRAPDFAPQQALYSAEFLALVQDARVDATNDRARAANRLLLEGVARSQAGDGAAARVALTESLELAPGQPRALQALAALDLSEGRTAEALVGFETVLALARSQPGAVPRELEAQTLNNIGVVYFGRQQYEDAAEALERATSLSPRDARAWFNLALARLATGRKIDGSRALERARELDPNDPEIALRLAQLYRETASWIEAVALLVDATRRHPEDAALVLELAWAQRGLGNRDGMMTSLARATELDPQNAAGVALPATMARAESLLSAGGAAGAAAASGDARRATELAPTDGGAWALRGLVERGEGRFAEAAQSLEKATALAPGRADFAHNLGTVYLAQKRLIEAETQFRRALELDPSFAEASAALARLESARASAQPPAKGARPSPPPRELGAELSEVDYQPLGIRGLLITRVTPGGLAARSGLAADDLVLRADGKPLTQVAPLLALVRNSKARNLQLSLLRAGKPVEIQLRLID